VLRDPNFGDIMVGGILPTQINQLFVSVQTFNSQQIAEELGNEHYDYVTIDEFHHAAATSYRYILDNIAPKSLLGLTATPERMDGFNVVEKYFDGHTTAELRSDTIYPAGFHGAVRKRRTRPLLYTSFRFIT